MPTTQEALDHLCEHYDLTMVQVLDLVRTPLHPRELRDEFAGQAMAAIIANADWDHPAASRDSVASDAYGMADAMLAARLPKET